MLRRPVITWPSEQLEEESVEIARSGMLGHACVDDPIRSGIVGGRGSEARFQLRLSALVWTRFEQKFFIPTLSAIYAGRK